MTSILKAPRRLAVLALALLGIAAAGCGSSSSSGSSSSNSSPPAATSTSSGSSSSGGGSSSSSSGSTKNGIPQGPNAGDMDADNQGAPSDGDGNM